MFCNLLRYYRAFKEGKLFELISKVSAVEHLLPPDDAQLIAQSCEEEATLTLTFHRQ